MIDADGIERPDKPDAHMHHMPIGKKQKSFNKRKDIFSKNPFKLFFGKALLFLVWLILSPAFKIIYRLKVENKKVLKKVKKKGVIMVCNHCHVMDSISIGIKTFRRNWFTSIAQNFQIPVIRTLVSMLGAIPIPHDLANMRIFKQVISERLQKRQIVTFFPEGSMWPYYRSVRPFKNGAFRFAVQNNVPVIPVVMCFWIKHKKNGKKKYRATLAFLEPLYFDPCLSEGEAIEDLKGRANALMKERVERERERDIFPKSVSYKQ